MLINFIKKQKNRIDAFIASIWAKSPKDKSLFIQLWVTVLGRFIGCGVTDRNYKPYWLSLLPGLVVAEYFIFLVYSVVYYSQREEYIKCLSAISIVGVVVPVHIDTAYFFTAIIYFYYFLLHRASYNIK